VSEPQIPTARHVVRQGAPAVLAAIGVAAVILWAYYVLPMPEGDDPPWLVVVTIVVVSLVYIVAGVSALFRIHRSPHPLRTGIVMLVVMLTAIVVIFALAYLSLSIDNVDNFNVPLDKISALYFTMTILSTVGFGDIHAQTHPAMIAVMIQMVVSLTLITTLARVLVEATRRATRKRYGAAP
jgi:phosphatidylglycerophosphate synthase